MDKVEFVAGWSSGEDLFWDSQCFNYGYFKSQG